MELAVVLHNIRSIHNVASIFRTADGAGVKKIYLCGITPAPVDLSAWDAQAGRFGKVRPQFAKVSLGAEKFVEWEHCVSTVRVIKKLKADGYKIFAIEQDKKSIPYYRVKRKEKKIALVLGNEVRGLPPSILKQCDRILEIPMQGAMVRQADHPRRSRRGKESLNVSVAFGVAAYRLQFP